jgi:hypothetical protein
MIRYITYRMEGWIEAIKIRSSRVHFVYGNTLPTCYYIIIPPVFLQNLISLYNMYLSCLQAYWINS